MGVILAVVERGVDADQTIGRLGVALAVGMLVGLQRQFAKQGDPDDLFAGARSFALIGLAGGLCAVLSDLFDSAIPFATGFVVVGGMLAIGYLGGVRAGSRGITTEIAAVVTFLTGAIAGTGEIAIAAGVGVATTALLALKPYTKAFVARIDREDVEATLQFAVVAVLVLPALPREPLGPAPFDAASPFNIGLMVVFILGLSFLGYVLIKVVGPRRGIGITGILGGLVSSTAVTLTMSERSKHSTGLLRTLSMAILFAWSIMYLRMLVEIGVVNADLLRHAAIPVGAGAAIIAVWAAYIALGRGPGGRTTDADDQRFSNPFSLGPAIQFGLLYGAVLIGSKALSMYLGETGVYVGAIVSGIADVDALTLSMAELSRGDGEVGDATAANAIVLAAASNTVVKGGLVWALSDHGMRKYVVPAVVATVVTTVTLTVVV